MQQIAEAAEYAVGTLYNFFESKQALFDELMKSSGEKIMESLMVTVDAPGTEVDRLTRFIRHTPELLEEHAAFVKLYVSEFGTRSGQLSKRRDRDEFKSALNAKLEQLLEASMRKGLFRRVDPAVTAKALNSTIEALAFEIVGQFDKAKAKDVFDKVEQLFIGGLLLPREQGDV
jgi:AcrR family transcriptional regulator